MGYKMMSVICMMSAFGVGSPLAGQTQTAAAVGVRAPMVQERIIQKRSPQNRQVSIQFDRMPLDRAMKEIAAQVGMRVTFSDAVTSSRALVTMHTDTLTAEQAMTAILGPHGFKVAVTPDGQAFLVAERKDASPSKAQEGVVTGRVIHGKTKQPVEGVRISVGGSGQSASVVTGKDGTFRISAASGTQTLTFRAVGFARHNETVTVTDDETVTVEVVLSPNASVLDEVVVTGTVIETERKAIPTPITVITAKDIEERGITRIEQLLRGEVPGVYALDFGSQAYIESSPSQLMGKNVEAPVFSRGASSLSGSPNPLKTYIDGVELLDASYLGTIDPQSIERIEIIVGPQAATIYGSDALGGVMQIFTKKGIGSSTPDITLKLAYGILENNFSNGLTPLHNDALQINGGAGTEFSYSGNLSYRYTGQWQPLLFQRTYGTSIGVTHHRGPVRLNGSASLSMVQNGSMNTNPGSIPCGYSSTGGCAATPYEYELQSSGQDFADNNRLAAIFTQRLATTTSQTFSLNADYRVTSIWNHSFTVGRSYTQLKNRPDRPTYYEAGEEGDTLWQVNRDDGQRTTANYSMTVSPRMGTWATTSIILGFDGSWGERSTQRGCLATPALTSYITCGRFNPLSTSVVTSQSYGGFGSWQLGLWDRLFLTLGLRGEHNPNYGSNHKVDWTPSNGLTFVAEFSGLTVKLLGLYGRSTRPPDPEWRLRKTEQISQGYDIAGEWVSQREAPNLTPEYSRGPQGGIELYYKNLGSLTVNRFSQTTDDLIQAVAVDSILGNYFRPPNVQFQNWFHTIQYLNTAKVRNQGWEGTGSINLWRFSIKGTYSWTDSRVLAVNPAARTGVNGCCAYRGLQPGEMFNYTPTHTGNLVIGYSWGGTSVTMTSNWRGTSTQERNNALALLKRRSGRLPMYGPLMMRETNFPHVEIPARTRSNVVMSQRLNPWASMNVNIQNLGNSYQSDAGAYWPTLGRQTLFGLSLRYPQTR